MANDVWRLNLEDYEEIVRRAKTNGKKVGDDMTPELLEYVKEKNIKPCGQTELNLEEFKTEQESHGKVIIDMKDINE